MKAFVVTTKYADASVLVWEETPAKAKHTAMGSLWLDGCDWNDLQIKREPRADGYKTTAGILGDDCTPEDCRLMRNLGWHQIDGSMQPCAECGRYEWLDVIESTMSGCDLCVGCAAAKINPLKKIREYQGKEGAE